MNSSKPTAANKPAATARRMATASRGSRAIIQVNNSHATRIDITTEAPRTAPPRCSAPLANAVNPMVSRLATNVETSAARSEILPETKPWVTSASGHHICVNAPEDGSSNSAPPTVL